MNSKIRIRIRITIGIRMGIKMGIGIRIKMPTSAVRKQPVVVSAVRVSPKPGLLPDLGPVKWSV